MAQSIDRECLQCGARLEASAHPNARFCSPTCRNRWNNSLTKMRPVQAEQHGTRTGYARGCRCDRCRRYVADYSRRYRAAQPKTPPKPKWNKGIKTGPRKPIAHGTSTTYAYGCRCQSCTTARTKQNAEWAKRNPEKFRAAQKRYRLRNPREAYRALAPFDDEALGYVELIASDPCVYCGGAADTIDHIEPVVRSHDSRWTNLAPACRSCNSAKGARSLIAFLLYRAVTDMETEPPNRLPEEIPA